MFETRPYNPSSINWERVLYVVFDLETTGRIRQRDEIIELAAAILDPSGIPIEDANFSEFIKPRLQFIPTTITAITKITYDMVKDAEPFRIVAESFIAFMKEHANTYSTTEGVPVEHLLLVRHNSKSFDVPFFVK
jgi:DNA polymerase III epsilon subunit-like protein